MFNKRLNETRKKKGITAQQMAVFLELGVRSYRRYESGDREPPLMTLIKIADILEVPVDYLLGRDEYVEGFIDKLQSES